MDIKRFFTYVLSIFGSMVMLSLVLSVVIVMFVIISRPDMLLGSDFLFGLSIAKTIIVIIGGFVLGILNIKKKWKVGMLFKPNKRNTILSVIIAFSIVLIAILISGNDAFGSYTYKLPFFLTPLVALIQWTIILYPFSALCYYLYKNRKKQLIKKWTIIALIILFNPIFMMFFVSSSVMVEYDAGNSPCGLTVDGFFEPSPARVAGMQIGETIINIDGVKILSGQELHNYMKKINYSKDVTLITQGNKTYSFQLEKDMNNDRYILGVNISQAVCKR